MDGCKALSSYSLLLVACPNNPADTTLWDQALQVDQTTDELTNVDYPRAAEFSAYFRSMMVMKTFASTLDSVYSQRQPKLVLLVDADLDIAGSNALIIQIRSAKYVFDPTIIALSDAMPNKVDAGVNAVFPRCTPATTILNYLEGRLSENSGPNISTSQLIAPFDAERNPLIIETWLVELLQNCFKHLPKHLVYPAELDKTSRLVGFLRDFNFTALDLSPLELLQCTLFIFDDLDLFDHVFVTRAVQYNYRDNPYHNFFHAVDVLQFTYYLLRQAPILQVMLQPLDIFALLVSAISHDISHSSFNNSFLTAHESMLAVLYNNQSVLENYHSLLVFALLRQERFNFTSKTFTTGQWQELRSMVIKCILATDMASHSEYISRFRSQFGNFDWKRPKEVTMEERTMIAIIVIKCADISNAIRPFNVARRWADVLVQEFFHQGDWEKVLGLPVGAMNDRSNVKLNQAQVAFITKIAAPLYELAAEYVPGFEFFKSALEENLVAWQNSGQ